MYVLKVNYTHLHTSQIMHIYELLVKVRRYFSFVFCTCIWHKLKMGFFVYGQLAKLPMSSGNR